MLFWLEGDYLSDIYMIIVLYKNKYLAGVSSQLIYNNNKSVFFFVLLLFFYISKLKFIAI